MTPTIPRIVKARGIKEIVHFTSSRGFVGVIASRTLKCRNLLKKDEYIAHILHLNTKVEYDAAWKDFINFSISRINFTLFGISSNSWYKEEKWRILAFDPVILEHPGVLFVTTNNAYHKHLSRGDGPQGLEALFAPTVKSRYGVEEKRSTKELACNTTDSQAEVLYPSTLSTDFLRKIYVETPEEESVVAAQIEAVQHPKIEIVVAPGKFARS